MKIGLLTLQGAFIEHIRILQKLGVETVKVNLPKDLDDIDGLIIPGGESTTIGKLAVMYDLMEPLKKFPKEKPVWGTCAGMIFMAKKIDKEQPILKIMDIVVKRNAFGRQVDSFETELQVDILKNGKDTPFPAIFIRAPVLVEAGKNVQTIAKLTDGSPVAALEKNLLVTAFHPELTNDFRFHEFFISLV